MLGDDVLATAMKQLLDGSTDELGEAARTYNKRMLQIEDLERERQAAIVRRALDNEAGRAFLVWLARKTVFRTPAPAEQTAQMESYAIEKAKREGQASILFLLLEVLAHEERVANSE